MQQSVIDKFPDADIKINIVWIKKLPGDSAQTAQKAAEVFTDHRVCHFYDPQKSSGKAIAKCVGWTDQVAWDIYLFYKPEDEWTHIPPRPIHWMHQLKDSWAHQTHFCTGKDLVNELFRAMEVLFNKA